MAFHLKLFGTCTLSGPAGPLAGRVVQPRQLALLALLGAAPRGLVSRDKLAGYLWPDAPDEQARHLLSDAVYLVRHHLGDAAILASGDALGLGQERVICDVHLFLGARAREDWSTMAALYDGPFLDGFHGAGGTAFDGWLEAERIRCREEAGAAIWHLVTDCDRRGDVQAALTWLRRGRAVDPHDERIARRLMELLDRHGDRAGAVRTYRELQRLLRRELALAPAPETRALAQRIRER